MSIMPEHLVKRDGSVKPFDAAKITTAIAKAGKATGKSVRRKCAKRS